MSTCWWWEIILTRTLFTFRGRVLIISTFLILLSLRLHLHLLLLLLLFLLLLFLLLFHLLLIGTCSLLQMLSVRDVKCLLLLLNAQPLPLGLVFGHFSHSLGFSATFLRLEFMIA
jgi:hypothetical protein